MFHIIKQATGFKQYGKEKGSLCCGKELNSAVPWTRYENFR